MKKMIISNSMDGNKKKVIIIGAGAAGLMASYAAAGKGCETVIYEKNKYAGRKLRITGKGRCNITNNTDIDGLIRSIPGNGHFMYSSLYTFSNTDIVEFFEKNNLKTKIERGGRVFPVSDKSEEVVNTLLSACIKSGVKLFAEKPVEEIMHEDGKVKGIMLKNGTFVQGDSVILCTGGASYRATGSTGDGYVMAEKLGHTVMPLKPSLVPLVSEDEFVKRLQGLTLKNVGIKLINKHGKVLYEDFGEMLFTHFGVSGPIILSASRHVPGRESEGINLLLDMKPALLKEQLDERIQRDFLQYSRKQFKNSLGDLLPLKMIPVVIDLSGISPEKYVNQVSKEERGKLVSLLKEFQISIKGTRPIGEGIVTAGGICTDEINPSTMESKLVKGLYIAGEVLDVDGYTGGYNLTIAFSTGYTAGINS
ncbi:MAG: NAD(P)/FAD-dependent oxidoreductase [Eubacteriales bacterium]|nr:NAD(P)/FAD-dependent oxidoreductase [Eubacteriales bacterium]